MRILIVSQYFWPENFRINDFATLLADRGHTVEVLTGLPNYPEGKFFPGYGIFGPYTEKYGSVTVKRIPNIPRGKSRPLELILNYLAFPIVAGLLAPFRCRGRYDLIFGAGYSPVFLSWPALLLQFLGRGPFAYWIQDLWPESLIATNAVRSPFILSWVSKYVGFLYRKADLLLVQSEAFREQIIALGGDSRKVVFFPNWAEPQFIPILRRDIPETSKLPNGFRICFAGNLGVAQDLPTLIEAAKILKNNEKIHWVIYGDGRQKKWLEEQIQIHQLSNCVHIMGSRPVMVMPEVYSQMDLMLVSLCEDPMINLTIPGKIQSYLACGKPVLASLGGEGAKVILDSGAGWVVPPQSPKELASVVEKVANLSEAERNLVGHRGVEYYRRNFDSSRRLDWIENWVTNFRRLR